MLCNPWLALCFTLLGHPIIYVLVYQLVLPHGPIRINIRIESIIIIIYLDASFHLLNILTHNLKYILSLFSYNRFHFVHLHIYSVYI